MTIKLKILYTFIMKDMLINLLIIEDNQDDALLIKEHLTHYAWGKFKSTHVEYLKESFDQIEKNSFDLILLDLTLPDSRGLNTLVELQKKGSQIPIIVLTGLDSDEIGLKAIQIGAQDYLNKDELTSPTLARCIRYALERKRHENEREQLLYTLKNKNDELQNIIYTISHDLKTPLMTVMGFARELSENFNLLISNNAIKLSLKKNLLLSIEYIDRGTREIDKILTGLLKITRIGTNHDHFVRINMNHLLHAVIHNLKYNIEKQNILIQIAEELPFCLGEEILIQEVFLNLISNAVKYLDPGRQGKISITGQYDTHFSIYCISDNGIGISKKDQKKIFDLFQRANVKTGVSGEGLGLAIARRIINKHNGNIWITSRPGQGSRFYVSLPCS